ncbi:MAG: stage III sporulation protein D [Ruminococcaceae bacterium]|nr:stage III sporulation protein D [Oscillospiraceae bacterium]
MTENLVERPILLGRYIVENEATVRSCAGQFGISKSTVHKDVSEKLKRLDSSLYGQVKEILEKNKAERHIRGGIATKRKYLEQSGGNPHL